LNVATIHKSLVKEHQKAGKVWLREIKQLRPKSEDSKELVLVSAAPEPNRKDRRAFAASFSHNRRKFAHLVFNFRQKLKHPTMHVMSPAPIKIYRKPALSSAQSCNGQE
jgi:hypothetical protein